MYAWRRNARSRVDAVMSAGAWLEAPAMENKHRHKHLLLLLLTLAFLFVVFAICRFGCMFKPASFLFKLL